MIGVPKHLVENKLNEKPRTKPIWQKKRGQSKDRNKALNDEVDKLAGAETVQDC